MMGEGEGGGDLGDYFTASGRERENVTGKGRVFVKGVMLVIGCMSKREAK